MERKYQDERLFIFKHGLQPVYKTAWHRNYKGDPTLKEEFLDCFGEDVYHVCGLNQVSRSRKAKRCRIKVGRQILNGKAYFLTLTFKNEVLARTTEETRRQYVRKALKGISDTYVANIDYGKNTEREHYHAIVEPLPGHLATWKNGKRFYQDMPDLRSWIKDYGFVTIEKIGSTEDDMKKVAKYTAKLSAHALKESTLKGTKTPRLIYSRKRLKW